MVCLIKSQHKEDLKHYADILGSEEAAYYVLAMNNGYTLDKTPDGEVSSLYDALLTVHNGSEVEAIIAKSAVYTPDFMLQNGDWTEGFDTSNGSEEPSITTLNGNQLLCDNQAILSILNSQDTADELSRAEFSNMLQRDPMIREAIREERDKFIENQIALGTYADKEAEYRARMLFGRLYDALLRDRAVNELENALFSRFDNVFCVDGWYVGTGEIGELRAKLLNNIHTMLTLPGNITPNGDQQALASVALVRKCLLEDWNIDASIRPVIVQYLKLFADTNTIQGAFQVLKNDNKDASVDFMIDTIADYIEGKVLRSPTKTKVFEAISKAVEWIKNAIRWIIPKVHVKDYNARRNMLDSITSLFVANENIIHSIEGDLLFDVNQWKIGKDALKITAVQAIKQIREGIKSRIKSIKSIQSGGVYDDELRELDQWLHVINDLIKSNDINNKDELYEIVRRFLISAMQELQKASGLLVNMNSKSADEINGLDLMHIKSDIIGFYENIVWQYIKPIARESKDPSFQPGGLLYNSILAITNVLTVVKGEFDHQLERFCDNHVDQVIDDNLDIGDVERFRLNTKLWLRNKINNGELSFFDKFFASGISSQSPIVRMLDIEVRQANLDAHQSALAVGKKLLDLYEKARPFSNNFSFFNFMSKFLERDEDGKRTGNMISEINQGAFDVKIKSYQDLLDKKYNVKIDELGGRLFESDDDWRNYYDELDKEIEKIGGHRRYKADYYITRRKFLSRDTIQTIERLRDSINKLYNVCTEYIEDPNDPKAPKRKIINTRKLTADDYNKLQLLRRELQLLSNPYEVVFDPNTGRVVSIKPKDHDLLRMAREITAWNREKAKHVHYKLLTEKFNSDREALIKKYGDNSEEVRAFDYENTVHKISNSFYIHLDAIFGNRSVAQDVQDLLDRRSALKNLAYTKKGYYNPNLDLLSDDVFKELKSLDQLISDAFAKEGKITKNQYELYQQLVGKRWVKHDSSDQVYFTWLKNNSGLTAQEFADRYTYVDKKGVRKPLSIFLYISPNDDTLYVVDTLLGEYTEIDETSDWVDSSYDSSNKSRVQPDAERWRNEQFGELMKDENVKEFYKYLLKVNDMIWDNLEGVERPYRFQLPQRRAKSSRLVFRNGPLSNIKSMFSNWWSINERDTKYNEEFARRADGSIVETIPLRWIKRLDDPNTIDSNIVQSITDMLEMSILYKNKKRMLPFWEAMNFKLYGGFNDDKNVSKDQADRYRTHMSMYVYGRMRTGFKRNKKITGFEKFLIRLLEKANVVAHAKLMVHNIRSVFKNMIDSLWSIVAEVNGGKYFSYTDAKRAMYNMGKELRYGGAISSLGRVKVPTLTAALMQYNRVSGSINEIFDGQDLGWVRRIISAHWSMGEYSMVDYMYKGLITEMVYSSYRLIVNPNTGKKEYMNYEQAIYSYIKAGLSEADGIKQYNQSTDTLRNAYYLDEHGVVQIKPEFLDYGKPKKDGSDIRSKKLELRVATTINERAAVINGMLDQMDRNAVSLNYVGATILLMRGWLVSQQTDYQKRGHDFAVYSDDDSKITKDGLFKRITSLFTDSGVLGILSEDPRYKGLFNFGTGTIDNGMWAGLLNAYSQWLKGMCMLNKTGAIDKMTHQQKVQVRRMNACILAVLVLCAETFLFGSLWEGDPDSWVYAFLYNGALAAMSERFTQLGWVGLTFVLTDIVKTPAVTSTLLQDIGFIPAALMDLALLTYDKLRGQQSDSDMYDTVKSGSLKDVTNYQRDVMRATSSIPYVNELGIENLYKSYWSIPSYKSSTNWYANVAPNPLFAYIPRFGKEKKPQTGLYGLLLNEKDERGDNFLDLLHSTWNAAGGFRDTEDQKKQKRATR